MKCWRCKVLVLFCCPSAKMTSHSWPHVSIGRGHWPTQTSGGERVVSQRWRLDISQCQGNCQRQNLDEREPERQTSDVEIIIQRKCFFVANTRSSYRQNNSIGIPEGVTWSFVEVHQLTLADCRKHYRCHGNRRVRRSLHSAIETSQTESPTSSAVEQSMPSWTAHVSMPTTSTLTP